MSASYMLRDEAECPRRWAAKRHFEVVLVEQEMK